MKSAREGLQIQAAAAHKQGDAPLLQLTVDAGIRFRLELLKGDWLVWGAQVEQMVRYPCLLFRRRLGGAQIHLLVELARIHVDHR